MLRWGAVGAPCRRSRVPFGPLGPARDCERLAGLAPKLGFENRPSGPVRGAVTGRGPGGAGGPGGSMAEGGRTGGSSMSLAKWVPYVRPGRRGRERVLGRREGGGGTGVLGVGPGATEQREDLGDSGLPFHFFPRSFLKLLGLVATFSPLSFLKDGERRLVRVASMGGGVEGEDVD